MTDEKAPALIADIGWTRACGGAFEIFTGKLVDAGAEALTGAFVGYEVGPDNSPEWATLLSIKDMPCVLWLHGTAMEAREAHGSVVDWVMKAVSEEVPELDALGVFVSPTLLALLAERMMTDGDPANPAGPDGQHAHNGPSDAR